jgi:hypothetical protein
MDRQLAMGRAVGSMESKSQYGAGSIGDLPSAEHMAFDPPSLLKSAQNRIGLVGTTR